MIRSREFFPTSGKAIALAGAALVACVHGAFATPVASAGYTIATFAAAPLGATNPDSIAVVGDNVFVGYGNTASTTGTSGSSTIAKFDLNGNLIATTTVAGHNDGLRYDQSTGQLWSIQNEDANPNLVLINPTTLSKSSALIFSATPHGGGYDDVAFGGGKAFVSASNPTNNPNTGPAIVSAAISGGTVTVTSALFGNASAKIINTGATTTLNLQDPDSLIFSPDGRLVLDSQSDGQLVFVTNPGTAGQSVAVLDLSTTVDDTVFASGAPECLLISNRDANLVNKLCGNFPAGEALSAADSGFIGVLNETTGLLTPIATGLSAPHGLAFLPVPEPGSAGLLIGAFAGLAFFAGRHRTR